MIEVLDLMQIGKLTLQKERWDWGNVLQFEHVELMPAPYENDTVYSEIDLETAKKLVKHLQEFIKEEEQEDND